MKDSVGANDFNLKILREAAAFANSLEVPWIMAGDWNVEPSVLAGTNWLSLVQGRLVAPKIHTCNSKVYDYFVVSRDLAHAVKAVQVASDTGFGPHSVVRLIMAGNARRMATRRLSKPTKIPSVLPEGPGAKPPDYRHEPQANGECAAALSVAMKRWYTAARTEFACLMGKKTEHIFSGTHRRIMWRCGLANVRTLIGRKSRSDSKRHS